MYKHNDGDRITIFDWNRDELMVVEKNSNVFPFTHELKNIYLLNDLFLFYDTNINIID